MIKLHVARIFPDYSGYRTWRGLWENFEQPSLHAPMLHGFCDLHLSFVNLLKVAHQPPQKERVVGRFRPRKVACECARFLYLEFCVQFLPFSTSAPTGRPVGVLCHLNILNINLRSFFYFLLCTYANSRDRNKAISSPKKWVHCWNKRYVMKSRDSRVKARLSNDGKKNRIQYKNRGGGGVNLKKKRFLVKLFFF